MLDLLLLRLFALFSSTQNAARENREGFTENIGLEQMSLKEIPNLDEQRRG